MAVDAIAALVFGRIGDRTGINSRITNFIISSIFAPLVFLGKAKLALWEMACGAWE